MVSTGRGCGGRAIIVEGTGMSLQVGGVSFAAERGGGGDWGVVDYFTDLLKSGDNLAKVSRAGAGSLEDNYSTSFITS